MSMLEKAIALARKGFYVHPLIPNDKMPAFKGWQTLSTRDENLLKEWFSSPQKNGQYYNIGINCEKFGDKGEALVVIDMDMKAERKGELTVLKLELDNFLFPPTYEQKTPNKGKHFFYIAPKPVKSSHDAIGEGVEILSRGKQVVGAGSVLDGKEYTGNTLELVSSPEWLLNFNGKYTEPDPVEVRNSVDVNEEVAIQRAVYRLKASERVVYEGERNNRAFIEACFLKDLGVSASMTMELMLEHWNCTPMLDLHELRNVIDSAFRNGKNDPGAMAPETFFEPIEENPDDEEYFLTEINKTFAVIYNETDHSILEETINYKGEKIVKFITEQTFKRKLSTKYIQHKKGVTYYSDLWLKWNGRREYMGVCFSPEKEQEFGFYNMWKGFAVEPLAYEEASEKAKRGFDMYIDLLKNSLVGGIEKDFEWLFTYFAHLVQRPFERPEVTLVFKGSKGTGKNVSMGMIGKLLGSRSYIEVSNMQHALGSFNQLLENRLMLVLDEAFWGGNKGEEGQLKYYTTSPTITINAKFQAPYVVDNLMRIAILGNEDWLAPASEDERRYAVFNVSDAKKQNHAFFSEMCSGMEEGGLRILLHALKNWNLNKANIRIAPKTKALAEQKTLTLQPFEQFWLECLRQEFVIEGEDWPTELKKDDLRNHFYYYAKGRGIKSRLPDSRLIGRLMKKINPTSDTVKKRDKDERYWAYWIPSLEICRKEFETFIGHEMDWDE